MRAFILVLDSVGIGAAPDAGVYGDAGADTLGHIADWCARKATDGSSRSGPLRLPHLVRLGLGEACRLAAGRVPPGLEDDVPPIGRFACAREISRGKDTPSGHWELCGVPVPFDWGYFPRQVPTFPPELIDELCARAKLPGILGDCHASGTAIIAELGAEHMRSGRPICYTSSDSVFQVAAHEETFGLSRLYDVCKIARDLTEPLEIGRVIARPFVGSPAVGFRRTGNRRDFSIAPPAATLLDRATVAGRDVISVGKVADIFAHRGTGRVLKAAGNDEVLARVLEATDDLSDGGLTIANLVEFDSDYGHRRDAAGYAAALERFDRELPRLLQRLQEGDLLVITADHGCDPTWSGTDHTREQVPVLLWGRSLLPGSAGRRATFADVGATVAAHLELEPLDAGTPIRIPADHETGR